MKLLTDKEFTQAVIRKTHRIDEDLLSKKYSIQEIGELIPGYLVVNDVQSRYNLYISKKGSEALGYSQEELEGRRAEFFDVFFYQKDNEELFRQWDGFVQEEDTERVYGFFQRVKTYGNNDWEWYYTTAKFRKDDLSKTIFIAHSVREMPQLVDRFDKVIEEELFYRKNYERFQTLTKREKEILKHIALGETSKNISDRLFISQFTVNTHRKRIMHKLEAKSIAELVRFAIAFRLIK